MEENARQFVGELIHNSFMQVHGQLSQLHEIISDDDGDDILSPIGSPPAEISALGGRDKFLQLKKKLEEDQAKYDAKTLTNS